MTIMRMLETIRICNMMKCLLAGAISPDSRLLTLLEVGRGEVGDESDSLPAQLLCLLSLAFWRSGQA